MAAILYPLYTLAHLGGLVWGLRLWQRSRSLADGLVVLVVAALVYDNLILSIGTFIGVGPALAGLSLPRFLMHQLFTPLLVVAVVDMARRAGLAWAAQPRVQVGAWLLAGALVLFGLLVDFVGKRYEPASFQGTLRYTMVDSGPPLPAIVTILVALGVGALLWRKRGWPWLFGGALVMFVSSAIPARVVGPAVGSGGEVFLMLSLLATAGWVAQRPAAPTSEPFWQAPTPG